MSKKAESKTNTKSTTKEESKMKDKKEKRNPAATLKRYRDKGNYSYSDGYAGLSLNNGDDVATALRMFEPDRVVAIAEAVLPGIEAGELAAKYAKLNPGMRRMNAGNRIRAAIKAKRITKTALKRALKAS